MLFGENIASQFRSEQVDYAAKHGEKISSVDDGTTYRYATEYASQAVFLNRQHANIRNTYRLMPRQFVMSMVAQYDSFFGKIIRFMFAVKPELLNASDRALAFTDLVLFPDIEAAREFIIEKEIESVIRKSHADQFAWLKGKLNTSFNKELPCWPTFIELTERRNLFVHTDGRVSSQYLSVCESHEAFIAQETTVGSTLDVPNEYFQEAYKCVFEIGVKMAHVIWRRLCPDRINESDNNINDITFYLIQNDEYELAIRILSHFTSKQIKHANDSNRRTMLINIAQAYKWSGRDEECMNCLASVDWSACEDKFRLAVATLKGDYDKAYDVMSRLRHDGSFHQSFFRDWPVFRELRKEKRFLRTFEECYGLPFAMVQTTNRDESSDLESGEEVVGEVSAAMPEQPSAKDQAP